MSILVLLLLLLQEAGSPAAIAGTVVDVTSLPLPGATIELDDRVVDVSGEQGEFAIPFHESAPRRLRVTLDGFEPHESVVEPAATGIEIRLHVLRVEDLETRLDPSQFLRIHRSAIVRVDRIAEVQPAGSSRYRVLLLDGTTLVVSRSRAARLKGLIL